MPKKVVIIGGGIAGLSSGIYLQMNGFDTQILEMNNEFGGSCERFEQGEFSFEGNFEYVLGTKPNELYGDLWKELFAFDFKEISYFDVFASIQLGNGSVFEFYADPERLLSEVRKFSPEDVGDFEVLLNSTKALIKTNIPYKKPREVLNLIDYAKLYMREKDFFKLYNEWVNVSVDDFCKRLNSEELKIVLRLICKEKTQPMFDLLILLAGLFGKALGYPKGGSFDIVRNLKKRYLDLGGQLSLGRKVSNFIINDNVLTGIKLACETRIHADIVVSTVDAYDTFFRLLDEKVVKDDLKRMFKHCKFDEPLFKVFVGTSMDFKFKLRKIVYQIDKPVNIDNENAQEKIEVVLFDDRQGLAPKGKTSLVINIRTSYKYWENLKVEGLEKYNNEKEKATLEILGFFDEKFEGFTQNVEELKVVTPVDFYERTNNYLGSYWGWKKTIKSLNNNIGKKSYDLDNFYFAGKWVKPIGGLHDLALTGRDVAQIICKNQGKNFKIDIE